MSAEEPANIVKADQISWTNPTQTPLSVPLHWPQDRRGVSEPALLPRGLQNEAGAPRPPSPVGLTAQEARAPTAGSGTATSTRNTNGKRRAVGTLGSAALVNPQAGRQAHGGED